MERAGNPDEDGIGREPMRKRDMSSILNYADPRHAVKRGVAWCTMSTFIRGVARVPACGSRLEVQLLT